MLPRSVGSGPAITEQTSLERLPQLKSWPDDGGAFITLPQVYSEDPEQPDLAHSNLGMYRVQISGGQYRPNREVGLHYQIHRGIGVHHAAAIRQGQPLAVNVFVGGAPAMSLAAVMPLPEGLSELSFAGALAGHRIPMIARPDGPAIYAEADFTITGTVDPDRRLPEGPFGDHLGYYSLAHDYPVLRVERVLHRPGAIWPFTVVGRPPQEDTVFGQLIHELTGPAIPSVLPGVHAVHAVDAAGVHPLLLAIGSERYTPYLDRSRPAELLTLANAILGQGQLSLAKYLLIVAREDNPALDIHDIPAFLAHLLERIDWQQDLHFQTCTTIDTLDYSGSGLNQGSKLVIAATGPARRTLPGELGDLRLPDELKNPKVCLPGVLAVEGPPFARGESGGDDVLARIVERLDAQHPLNRFPLVVLVDDSAFAARSTNNFLWNVFTRSNPATDVYGVGSFVRAKHWGARSAGDRCPEQTASRAAPDRGSRHRAACRRPGRAGRSIARDHLMPSATASSAAASSAAASSVTASSVAAPFDTPLGIWLLIVGLFVFGSLFGSFANVVVYRLPLGLSLLWPGSHCPRCGRPIRWYDNVPIFGWLALNGRCRDCRAAISVRYPLVEALFGLVLAALGWVDIIDPPASGRSGALDGSASAVWLRLGCHFLLAGTLIVAALIEHDGRRVPGRLLGFALALGVGLLAAVGWLSSELVPGLTAAGKGAGIGLLLGALAWPAISPLSGRPWPSAGLLSLLMIGALLGPAAVCAVAVAAVLCDVAAALSGRAWPPAGRIGWGAWLAVLTALWLVGGSIPAARLLSPFGDSLGQAIAAGAIVAIAALVDWQVRRLGFAATS